MYVCEDDDTAVIKSILTFMVLKRIDIGWMDFDKRIHYKFYFHPHIDNKRIETTKRLFYWKGHCVDYVCTSQSHDDKHKGQREYK